MRAVHVSLLVLALAAPGCAAPHAQRSVGSTHAALPDDLLDLHVRALASKLEGEGLSRGALRERGFLPPSGRAAYPVAIAAGECAVFIAVATASMADLDAALYTAEGELLIEDDSTGARPALTYCAPQGTPLRAYLTLHAYQGAGSFVATQFGRPFHDGDDLHTANAEGSTSALGQLAQTLHERGFEDAAPRVSLALGAAPVRMAVRVLPGECYTLAAEGGQGLSELGLRLVDAAGGELASGVGEPLLAALQYCASDKAELSLEVSARRGQGVAQVARFHATQVAVGGARALWLGEPSPSPAAWSHTKVAHHPNERPAAAPFFAQRVPLRQGEVVELRVPAHAPCASWQAELAPGLSHATLRIESERGELLGEADSEQLRACVSVCAAPGAQRVALLGRTGFGAVALSAVAVPPPSPGAAGKQAGLVFGPASCHGSSAPSDSSSDEKGR